jgi:DNA (cytosine-5)-methyltransferase 1
MAGWSDDRPVWTCSCPCRPFSQTGGRKGVFDDRHLWPAAHWLIAQCRPAVIFGEQVASPDGIAWFDIVSSDLEALGYAVRASVLCSAGVGAPNIRHRLYWVALADSAGRSAGIEASAPLGHRRSAEPDGGFCGLGHTVGGRLSNPSAPLADGSQREGIGAAAGSDGRASNPWRELEWVECLDGKWRPVESRVQPVAAGYSASVARPRAWPLARRQKGDVQKIHAYGNAINPFVAAEFIGAVMDILS